MTSRWLPWLRPAECVPTGLERGDDPRGCREHFASLVEQSPLPSNDTMPRRANDVIDGVILVHYSRAPCRLRFQLAMLRRAGLPWQPPRLQLASQHDVEDFAPGFVRRCVSRRFCTDEELSQASCTANHVHAWHLALRLGWEATLVLEDDATLPEHARAMLQRRVEALPPGWTILNFACAGMERVRGCREGEGEGERRGRARVSSLRPWPRPWPTAHRTAQHTGASDWLAPSVCRHGTGSRACSRGYVLSRAGAASFVRHAGVIDHGADWLASALRQKREQTLWGLMPPPL